MSDEVRARFEADVEPEDAEWSASLDGYKNGGTQHDYQIYRQGWQACEASRERVVPSTMFDDAEFLNDYQKEKCRSYLAKFKVAEEPKFHCLLCKDVGHITVVHQSGGFDATNESCPVCRVAPTVGDNWDSYLASLPDDHPVWGHPLMAECMKQAYQAANETDNSVTRNYRATEFDSSADPQDSVGGDTQVSVPH